MKIAVVGAGAMGRWAVKELGISPQVEEVVVGDFDEEQARAVAASHGGGKARAVLVDARDRESVRAAIAGCDAMVNATQHFWNIEVMHAAAAAGVHYTDMGGLFHVTRQQVELDEEFRAAGVTAVIAMGGAPGVTNILAKYGAEQLDSRGGGARPLRQRRRHRLEQLRGLAGAVLPGDPLRRVQRRRPRVHRGRLGHGDPRRAGRGGRRLRRAGGDARGALHHPLGAVHLLARVAGPGPAQRHLQARAAGRVHRRRCASSSASG